MTLEFYSIWWTACDDSVVATKPAQAGSKSQGRAIPGGAGEGGTEFQISTKKESVSKCFPETSGSKKRDHVFSSTVDWGRLERGRTQQNHHLLFWEDLCQKCQGNFDVLKSFHPWTIPVNLS